jgi:hypothetical protein
MPRTARQLPAAKKNHVLHFSAAAREAFTYRAQNGEATVLRTVSTL